MIEECPQCFSKELRWVDEPPSRDSMGNIYAHAVRGTECTDCSWFVADDGPDDDEYRRDVDRRICSFPAVCGPKSPAP